MVKMVNSIAKGKVFERKVAKILSEKLGCKFFRVPNSGGLATSQGRRESKYSGDIYTEDPRYCHITIECKKTNKPIDLNEWCCGSARLNKWFDQCRSESKDGVAWLIFGWDYGEPLICQINKTSTGWPIHLDMFLELVAKNDKKN